MAASDAHIWDFFIAHAGTDKASAESLYELLTPRAKVFLDSRCLELGDDWDRGLKDAQRQALISVVLVSPGTDDAYYQREEIAAAVDLARNSAKKHRVIPVYLESGLSDHHSVPYGLRLKHGLTLPDVGGMQQVAMRLLDSLSRRIRNEPADADDDPRADPAPEMQPFNPHVVRPPAYQQQPFQQQPFQPPPFPPQGMPRYVLQCVFPDNMPYYVLEDDNILCVPPGAPPVFVGRKTPPTWPGFVWMYSTPGITYGVDPAGRIWNRMPNGMPFQVGYVINVA
jgi:hypothetical protein